MKLSHRLLINGAVIPTTLLLASLAAAAWLFNRSMLQAMDRALIIQAAMEASSLFDGDDGEPHRHTDSPLEENVRTLAATGGLYTLQGDLVVPHPATASVPKHISAQGVTPAAHLRTLTTGPGSRERELLVRITSPRGQAYLLRMATSLAAHEATMTNLYRSGGIAGLLMALLMIGVQLRHARALMRRIRPLAAHMQRLQHSDFEGLPPPDQHGDVLSDLRDAAAETTLRLRAARSSASRFLADAAHEMRTPVAAMSTDIDVTLRRERDIPELREALGRARQVAARLTRLANDLLDITAQRQTTWDQATTDVAEAVAEILHAHKAAAEERGIQLIQAGVPHLQARFQPDALRQVLTNLVSNALRYAPRGTLVRVDVADHGENWSFSVEDDGPGVPESEREAVFEPFHRHDRRGQGAGLGLAIVRDVAHRHGGRAFVQASATGGARFVVEVPHQMRMA